MACCIETAELARDTDHVFNKEDAENEYDLKEKKELFNRLFIHLASSSVCWDLFCIIYFIYLLSELF